MQFSRHVQTRISHRQSAADHNSTIRIGTGIAVSRGLQHYGAADYAYRGKTMPIAWQAQTLTQQVLHDGLDRDYAADERRPIVPKIIQPLRRHLWHIADNCSKQAIFPP